MVSMTDTEPAGALTKDIVAYRKKYYQEHKEKYRQYATCDICGGKYQLFNKFHHRALKKHLRAIEQMEKDKEIAELKKKLEQCGIDC